MSAGLIIKSEGLKETGAALDNLFGPITIDAVKKAMGAAVRLELINHFTELEGDSVHHRTADRLGAPHSGFFSEAASSVQLPVVEAAGVSVSINKLGLALRYFGGTVTPGKNISWKTGRPTQWLSIPAVASAYGRRTQEFDFSGGGTGNLHFVFFRPDLAALVENLASVVKRTRKGVYKHVASTIGTVIFWLKKEMTYAADPTILPTAGVMINAAIVAGEKELVDTWDRPVMSRYYAAKGGGA